MTQIDREKPSVEAVRKEELYRDDDKKRSGGENMQTIALFLLFLFLLFSA
jgi:hypothetical protein